MSHSSKLFSSRFGVIARSFNRPDLKQTLDAVRSHGSSCFQLNLANAGLTTLPETFESAKCKEIAKTIQDSGMKLVALSGTFNMIDPDVAKRKMFLDRLPILAQYCQALDVDLITLCSGTRDPLDMWKKHPDNNTPEAWSDLVESMAEAIRITAPYNVTLAFEPEVGNVVDTAPKARKLIDRIGSNRLKIVLDAANLIQPDELSKMRATIDEAFELLTPDIAIVHAKEISAQGEVGETAPGKGVLDFGHVFRRYLAAKLNVPIVMHGLPEADVAFSAKFLANEFAFAEATKTFEHDGIKFRYFDIGSGTPFVFQHGLGGDCKKMFDLLEPLDGFRVVSFDARYHGVTRPLGPEDKIGFVHSANDLLALLDHLRIEKAVIGGISMGAGIALTFAARHPERTLALILSRPAWFDEPIPANVRMFPEMAAIIREHGTSKGLGIFTKTETYTKVLADSSDSASALVGMFQDPTTEETVAKFELIPRDCPPHDLETLKAINVPTLVLANHQDPIHPYPMAPGLASVIPNAELQELTPKCVSISKHEQEFNQHVRQFLARHIGGASHH